MIVQYGLGFGAGVLSLLAPCVLPLIPIIFGSSLRSSKWGPLANAFGLTLSFTIVGVLTSLFASIFDVGFIQKLGAVILLVVGFVFLVPKFKDFLTDKLSFVGNKGHELSSYLPQEGLASQFLMGMVLGMIWGPCSGPTLAFAFGIATQSEQVFHATLIFFFFGLGAGTGLVGLGFILKKFASLKGKLLSHNNFMNKLTGVASLAIGVLILSDQLLELEESILSIMPSWLVNLSVSL